MVSKKRNILISERFPELLSFYSNKNKEDFSKITISSRKTFKWKCSNCLVEFSRSAAGMTKKDATRVCEACRYVVLYGNSLKENYPDIAKLYSKNNKTNILSVSKSSSNFFLWNCAICNEEFKRKAVHMTQKDSKGLCDNCRYIESSSNLTKKIIDRSDSLASLGKNTLNNFFDYSRNDKKPEEIPIGSNNYIYLKCRFNHKTKRKAYNFSKNPVCTKCYTQTSKLEIRIFSEFKLFYLDTLWQEKIKNVEFDIYIPSKKIAIEVDGSNWHKDIKKDLKKNNFATDNGIFLFRIRTGNLPYIENSFQTDFKDDRVEVMIDMCDFLIKSKIHPTLFNFAKKWRKKNNNNYLNGELFNELYFRLPSPPYEQSLQHANHELDKEWSEKNYPLKTNDIKPYSNTKYYWKCNESKHHPDYLMSPAKKMLGKGCPCCAGKELAHDNSLEYLKPIIAKRWNYKKNNDLKPNEVLAGSSKEYWFICENNHEWQDSLAHIKNNINSRPCKKCKSLSFNFPDLVKEWDFLKNELDIDYVHHGSNKSVYWKCSNCMHEYKNSISNKTRRGDKCPECSYPNL